MTGYLSLKKKPFVFHKSTLVFLKDQRPPESSLTPSLRPSEGAPNVPCGADGRASLPQGRCQSGGVRRKRKSLRLPSICGLYMKMLVVVVVVVAILIVIAIVTVNFLVLCCLCFICCS